METYIVMKFATSTGTDISITVPNAKPDVTAEALRQVMQDMITYNAVDAGENRDLVGIQTGTLCKVNTQAFQFA